MYRLSLIIGEIYNKYLPLAEKDGVRLNLDFSDTTQEIADPERIKQDLDTHLQSALQRTTKDEISIAVTGREIVITDAGTTLSKPACALLSNRFVTVKSRVGFGTTITIALHAQEDPHKTIPSTDTPQQAQSVTTLPKTAIDQHAKAPKKQTSPTKRTRPAKDQTVDRKIRAAAKKADKEVRRIMKKASKRAQTTRKKPAKTRKRLVLE